MKRDESKAKVNAYEADQKVIYFTHQSTAG